MRFGDADVSGRPLAGRKGAGPSVPRVRHHSDDAGWDGIWEGQVIFPSRGIEGIDAGVHVEVEPFGSTRPGLNGPRAEMGCFGEGAYVEFDAPASMVATNVGPRNTAIIPTRADLPLSLRGLNARFVRVRGRWWQFWRVRPE